MNKFEIDFAELSFLAEACIPPRPIARAMFWNRLISEIYNDLTLEQSSKLYSWIKRNDTFEDGIKDGNEDCLIFEARYNPDNQYEVTTEFNGEVEKHKAFKYKDKFFTTKSKWIAEEYIKRYERI